MQEDIFLLVFERALSLDPSFPVDFSPRWIKRLSASDAELMSKGQATCIKLSMLNAAVQISYNDATFLGVSGFPVPEKLPPGLMSVEVTPALFSIFVVESRIDSIASAAEIRDATEGFSGLENDYQGHDLETIQKMFPLINFYEIEDGYIHKKSFERTLGAYVARGYAGGPLRLTRSCRNKLAELFENGSDTIPFELPLRGLLSYSWQGFFIELYRCVEQLYSVPKVKKLRERIGKSNSVFATAQILEDILSWRPREEESIELLFEAIDDNVGKRIVRACGELEPAGMARVTSVAARRIYSLRNSCVHFRPATIKVNMNDSEWNEIAESMIDIIEELYRLHGTEFHYGSQSL